MRATLFTQFSFILFSGCSQPNTVPGLEYQYKSGHFKMKTLTWLYGPYRPYSKYVTSAFKAYKLTYQSEVEGIPVTLSGSILIPRDYMFGRLVLFFRRSYLNNLSQTVRSWCSWCSWWFYFFYKISVPICLRGKNVIIQGACRRFHEHL